jgi:hypothetical protein
MDRPATLSRTWSAFSSRWLLLLTLGWSAACGSARQPGAPTVPLSLADPPQSPGLIADLAGCWEFTPLADGQPEMPGRLIVRLDTVRAQSSGNDALRLVTDSPVNGPNRLGGWGLLEAPNEVAAFWGRPDMTPGGLDLRLTYEHGTLSGRATRNRFYESRSSFPVRAQRATCPRGLETA